MVWYLMEWRCAMVWYGMAWYEMLFCIQRLANQFCKEMDGLDGGNIK